MRKFVFCPSTVAQSSHMTRMSHNKMWYIDSYDIIFIILQINKPLNWSHDTLLLHRWHTTIPRYNHIIISSWLPNSNHMTTEPYWVNINSYLLDVDSYTSIV